MTQKRHLKRMRMTKIDLVDRPAQAHATTTITKRNGGETMTEAEMEKIAEMVSERLSKGQEEEYSDEDIAKAMGEAEDALLSTLSEEDANLYKSMPAEQQEEALMEFAEDPERFLSELDEADSEIQKAVEADAEDARAQVGDMTTEQKAALFDELMEADEAEEAAGQVKKGMDVELAKRDERIEQLEGQLLFKRATDEVSKKFPHFPGDDNEKVALYMGIQNLDKSQQEAVTKALEIGEKAQAQYFSEIGSTMSNGDVGKDALDSLNKSASALAKSNGIPYAEAYQQVLMSPEGAELYKSYKDETQGASH